jgi:radical SAM family uncharacterized protein
VKHLSWNLKNRLKEIAANEQGAALISPGARRQMALIYPNEYHVGMNNLGIHIIYRQINNRQDIACERFFLPDKKMQAEYLRTNTPLLSIETQRPLYEFPLIAFAVSFEMDYFNLIKMLSLGKVPELAAERTENDPLIIIGGPCATFNPEPLADFVDVCIIGEGEEVINEVLDVYNKCAKTDTPREKMLLTLAQINGVYVPKYYQPCFNNDKTIKKFDISPNVPQKVKRRYVENLADYSCTTLIKTSDTQFKDMYLIETARGCGRHCRFCMAGYCFRKPRIRPAEMIIKAAKEAKEIYNLKKIGLVGAAVSDHEEIDKICQGISLMGLDISTASLRADSLSKQLLNSLAKSGHKTITLAPEAGSERLRRVINKNITDNHLETAISSAVLAGINNVRLYIMIGLPTETNEDIEAIVSMAKNIKRQMEKCGSRGLLTLSINTFVPKPSTPFQWLPMADEKEINAKTKKIKDALKTEKGIKLTFESTKETYIQAILARGDRALGGVLLKTQKDGLSFKDAMKQTGLDENFYLYRQRGETEILPWHNLSMGFKNEYLYEEYLNSSKEKQTPPCSVNCRRCGIC